MIHTEKDSEGCQTHNFGKCFGGAGRKKLGTAYRGRNRTVFNPAAAKMSLDPADGSAAADHVADGPMPPTERATIQPDMSAPHVAAAKALDRPGAWATSQLFL